MADVHVVFLLWHTAAEIQNLSCELRPFFPVITKKVQKMAGKHFEAAIVPFPSISLNYFSNQKTYHHSVPILGKDVQGQQ